MGKEGSELITKVTRLNMSRGEQDEVDFDLEKVEDMFVVDEMGNKIRFGDIYKRQKTIIVFTRSFLCYTCKEYVDDLAIIPDEYLQEAGVRVVVIGPSDPSFIRQLKQETTFHHSVYVDPQREIFKVFGFKQAMTDRSRLNTSKHVKSTWLGGVMRSTMRAMWTASFKEDMHQNGGTIIAGPGNQLHYSHIDQHLFDHSPINDLLKAAQVRPVSFPLDPRVQIV